MSLASLIDLPATPSVLLVSFSVLLVLSLVAAEESERRRDRAPGGVEG